jgi:hypothetical protein
LNASIFKYRALPSILLIAAALSLLSGCRKDQPVLDDPTASALSALRYPGKSDYGPDLDIIVVRQGSSIRLTNRTPRSYQGMQLWLNQQYVQQADTIAIGGNPDIHLATLINRHREPFPIGSFLKPDRARLVISAELYDPAANVRYRLTVQPDNNALRL